jgi:hypothetical protein
METIIQDLFSVAAIALLVPLIAIRIARHKAHRQVHEFAGRTLNPFRKTEGPALTALKKCPSCAEELPLSALICDGCDYNFLAGSTCYRHKMLPAPEPDAEQQPTQQLAYQAISH